MAEPFAKPKVGNLGADDVNLRPTRSVDETAGSEFVNTANLTQGLLNVAVDANQQAVANRLMTQLEDTQQAFARQREDDINLRDSQLAEAQNDPAIKQNLGAMDRLNSSFNQGRMSRAAYIMRTEDLMNQAIADAPGFANEIKTLTKDKMGFDPTGTFGKSLLEKTPEELRFERINELAVNLQVDLETAERFDMVSQQRQIQDELLLFQAQQGQAVVSSLVHAASNELNQISDTIVMSVRELIGSGGVFNEQEQIAQLRIDGELIKAKYDQMLPSGSTSSDRDEVSSFIDNRIKNITEIISNGSVAELAKSSMTNNQMLTLNALYGDEVLAPILILSEKGAPAMFELLSRSDKVNNIMRNISERDSRLSEILQGNFELTLNPAELMLDIGHGKYVNDPSGEGKLTSDSQKSQAATMAYDMAIQPNMPEEFRVKGISSAASIAGVPETLRSYDNDQAFRSVMDSHRQGTKEYSNTFVRFYNSGLVTNQAGVSERLALLGTTPDSAMKFIEYDPNLRHFQIPSAISIEGAAFIIGDARSIDRSSNINALRKELESMNVILNLSRRYISILDIDNIEGLPQTMLDELREKIVQLKQVEKENQNDS